MRAIRMMPSLVRLSIAWRRATWMETRTTRSCGEASIILYFMGAPLGIASIVILESLAYAIRSAAFFVPAAAGVSMPG